MKQENANLLSKVHHLEEQIRDIEVQSEERRKEDEKRLRDSMARLDREKSSENEKYLNRIYNLQQELFDAKIDARKFQNIADKLRDEKDEMKELLCTKEEEIEHLKQEVLKLREVLRRCRDEEIVRERVCNVLQSELNDLKQQRNHQIQSTDHQTEARLFELERTLSSLRIDNKSLKEANEELQAQLLSSRLEEGRCLIRNGERVTTSLADELVTLNEEQVSCYPAAARIQCKYYSTVTTAV